MPYKDVCEKDLDAYTSRVLRSQFLIALVILPFLPVKQFWNIQNYSNLQDGLRNSVLLVIFYLIVLLISLIVRRFRIQFERFGGECILVLDLMHTSLSILLSFIIIDDNNTHNDPRERYLEGCWTAVICIAFFGTISKWFLRVTAYLVLVLRIGLAVFISQKNYSELITMLQLILFLSLKTYFDERGERSLVNEKQALMEDVQILKGLQNKIKTGIAACDLKGKVVMNNMSQQLHRWWINIRNSEENLSQIKITRRKENWDDSTVRIVTV